MSARSEGRDPYRGTPKIDVRASLCEGPHAEQAKAVGPDHVHHQHDKDGGRNQCETQVTLFVAEVHKVHDAKTRLNQSYRQHAHEQLGTLGVLVGEGDLHSKQGKDDEVHDDVSFQIVFHVSRRAHRVLSRSSLSSNIQQIDHRHHEHPDQIYKVPVQRPGFEIVGVVASPPVP